MDTTIDVKLRLPWYRRLKEMKGLVIALMSMAQLLDIISISSITITLPDIQRDVGFKVDQLQWVASAYALAYGASLLAGGRFGDLFGHRLIFIVGSGWFSIWALVSGFAKDPIVMSIGRAFQGVGAGFTVPSALAILTTSYPVGPERNQALAIFGGTAALGSVLGTVFGGILGSYAGWRWIFYITSIIGCLMVFLGLLIIPDEKGESASTDRRIDYIGLTSFTFGIVGVIYYLSEGPAAGWASAQALAPFLVVHGVGIIVTIGALTKLVTFVRTKIIMTVGWLFFIGSGILFAQIKQESSYWSIAFPALILNCLGLAPSWLCCQLNSVADADDGDQGVVGAVYNVALQIGAPLGIAISNIVANSLNAPGATGVDLLPGYRAAFYTCAGIGGLGLFTTVLIAANQDIKYEEKTSSGVAVDGEKEKLSIHDVSHTEELSTDNVSHTEDSSTDNVSHTEGMETARNSQILEEKKDYHQ
ncbi:hypothetical protein BGZ99_006885 [Dissophora globulifera]|uniref:Major facilitator superfamily (MFS) profile domain-containing protein n=1 Tax=Dissophora globulifera TaxID=979702 RepID=A0A9P6RUM6_9FUNG|nr:hypothetical protein BGZ99_006885 [Dissophora globulifera]